MSRPVNRRTLVMQLALLLAGVLGMAMGVEAGGPSQRKTADVATTVGVMRGPTLPGGAVYPAQEIPLRFNHAKHLAKGLQCTRCHTEVTGSTRSAELNFPTGRVCDQCHGGQHPRPKQEAPRCTMCHTRVEGGRVTAALDAPKPLLSFNHALHLSRGSRCEDCHKNMDKVRLATTSQLPTESDCLTCHDGETATDRCGACHPSGAGGRLITRARDDRLRPQLVPQGRSGWGMAHDLAFVEDHSAIAKTSGQLCDTCHDEDFCQDCHAGAIRPMRIHAGDYLTLHAMEARGNTADCQACHRAQTFCLSCHERLGFGERDQGTFGVGGSLRFHPDNWTQPPGVPQGHAHAAQRNIGACASCHDEDSCLACHATSAAARIPGLDINPHGPSFATSPRCQALARSNHRVCLRCHAPGDPNNDCLP